MTDSEQFHARKRFGQNFLVDLETIDRIIAALSIKASDKFIEIGPGLGALTEPLLTRCNILNVVEIDWDMAASLEEKLGKRTSLIIHREDALDFDLTTISERPHIIRLVGNLPYNISTPLLFHFMAQCDVIKDMHFMLQKEVVDRIVALPGENNYGRLSVMLQYHCQVEALFNVPNTAFNPVPQVSSTFLRLVPYHEHPAKATNVKTLENVVKQAFGQRRKTLRNNLKPLINDDALLSLNIDPNLRPEQISVENYVKISNFVDYYGII